MKNNVLMFCDPAAEDALARLTEQRWQEVRRERMEAERKARRARERKVHWATNVILIGCIAVAAFCAGLCVGVM